MHRRIRTVVAAATVVAAGIAMASCSSSSSTAATSSAASSAASAPASAASSAASAGSSAAASAGSSAPASADRRPRPRVAGRPSGGEDQDPVAVVHPGPVRRLHRGAEQGLLQGAGARRDACSRAAPHRAADHGGAGPGGLRHRLGTQGAAVTGAGCEHHRRRAGVPALGHDCRSPSRTRTSPRQRDLKGKKVGNWGFGNEFELFAGMTKAGLDPSSRTSRSSSSSSTERSAQRRHRRRPGDDLQRVRAGARSQEPEDRQAVHPGGFQRDQLEPTTAPPCCRTPSGPTPRS